MSTRKQEEPQIKSEYLHHQTEVIDPRPKNLEPRKEKKNRIPENPAANQLLASQQPRSETRNHSSGPVHPVDAQTETKHTQARAGSDGEESQRETEQKDTTGGGRTIGHAVCETQTGLWTGPRDGWVK